nr:uncharacterized protein LOC109424100 [Aedes albopictus]
MGLIVENSVDPDKLNIRKIAEFSEPPPKKPKPEAVQNTTQPKAEFLWPSSAQYIPSPHRISIPALQFKHLPTIPEWTRPATIGNSWSLLTRKMHGFLLEELNRYFVEEHR